MRLDKFLKVSRLVKRRTVANELCSLGRVEINGKPAKPAAEVKPGDTIGVRQGERILRVRVEDIREHVAKADATALYSVVE